MEEKDKDFIKTLIDRLNEKKSELKWYIEEKKWKDEPKYPQQNFSNEKVTCSKRSSPTENQALNITETDENIENLQAEIFSISQELCDALEKLEDLRKRRIILYVYIHGYSTKIIAEKLALSESYTRKLKQDVREELNL